MIGHRMVDIMHIHQGRLFSNILQLFRKWRIRYR